MLSKGGAHGLVEIGARVAGILNQIQAVQKFEIGNTCRRADGVGGICPTMPQGAEFIGAILKNLPNFVGNNGS